MGFCAIKLPSCSNRYRRNHLHSRNSLNVASMSKRRIAIPSIKKSTCREKHWKHTKLDCYCTKPIVKTRFRRNYNMKDNSFELSIDDAKFINDFYVPNSNIECNDSRFEPLEKISIYNNSILQKARELLDYEPSTKFLKKLKERASKAVLPAGYEVPTRKTCSIFTKKSLDYDIEKIKYSLSNARNNSFDICNDCLSKYGNGRIIYPATSNAYSQTVEKLDKICCIPSRRPSCCDCECEVNHNSITEVATQSHQNKSKSAILHPPPAPPTTPSESVTANKNKKDDSPKNNIKERENRQKLKTNKSKKKEEEIDESVTSDKPRKGNKNENFGFCNIPFLREKKPAPSPVCQNSSNRFCYNRHQYNCYYPSKNESFQVNCRRPPRHDSYTNPLRHDCGHQVDYCSQPYNYPNNLCQYHAMIQNGLEDISESFKKLKLQSLSFVKPTPVIIEPAKKKDVATGKKSTSKFPSIFKPICNAPKRKFLPLAPVDSFALRYQKGVPFSL